MCFIVRDWCTSMSRYLRLSLGRLLGELVNKCRVREVNRKAGRQIGSLRSYRKAGNLGFREVNKSIQVGS